MLKTLYLIMTNKCQLNCPFCYTKFIDQFNDTTDLNPATIISYLRSHPEYKIVIFHGGEPLMVSESIIEIMSHRNEYFPDIDFEIQSNLAFKELSRKQIEALCMFTGYGTSYNFDRFYGKGEEEGYWIHNMGFLHSLGLKSSIIITITEAQINNQSPASLKNYLDGYVHYDRLILERPIIPIKVLKENREYYTELYKRIDDYLAECFEIFPKEKNNWYHNIKVAAYQGTTLFNIRCSSFSDTMFKGKLQHGCTSLEKINVQDNKRNMECLQCPYFKYCMGDCECMNIVCTFPKKTFTIGYEYLRKENQNVRLPDLGM